MMSPEPIQTPKPRRVLLIGCAVGAAAIGLAVSGVMDRAKSKQELETWTDEQAVPTVRLVQPQRGPDDEQLVLPGNVSAYYTGSLFARASGYVTAWR
jgi:membrane fusion protein (multidrug efflux system)